jgi:hypothetical protein
MNAGHDFIPVLLYRLLLGSSLPNLIDRALQYRAEDHGQTDGYEYSIDRPPSRAHQIPKYFMHCALYSKVAG